MPHSADDGYVSLFQPDHIRAFSGKSHFFGSCSDSRFRNLQKGSESEDRDILVGSEQEGLVPGGKMGKGDGIPAVSGKVESCSAHTLNLLIDANGLDRSLTSAVCQPDI